MAGGRSIKGLTNLQVHEQNLIPAKFFEKPVVSEGL